MNIGIFSKPLRSGWMVTKLKQVKPRLRRSAVVLTPGSIPGQFMWDLGWKKWRRELLFSQYIR